MGKFTGASCNWISLWGLVAVAMLQSSCARKHENELSGSVSKREVEQIPNVDERSDKAAAGVQYDSFSLNALESNAPLDLADMVNFDDTAAAAADQRGFGLTGTGNSSGFRSWYADSIEPEKSKYFSISCEKVQARRSERIILVRLKDLSKETAPLETVAFRIVQCDNVRYGLMNLEDNKMYNLSARVYKLRRDARDPESSLFTTEQVLEGTSGVITKTTASSLTYRRVVDGTAEKIDTTIVEDGQNENDPLLGGDLKITVWRMDETNMPKPVPNAKVTLKKRSFDRPVVELMTNAEGVAMTKGLVTGTWAVKVARLEAGGFTYQEALSMIDVKANENLDHKITLQPSIYGWLFVADIPLKLGPITAKVRIQAGLNERPDVKGSHEGYAYQSFLKYCSEKYTELAKQATKPDEKAAYDAIAGSLGRKEATLAGAYKFTSSDQKQKIASTERNYLSTEGVQIMWTDKPASAPFGGSGSCPIQ